MGNGNVVPIDERDLLVLHLRKIILVGDDLERGCCRWARSSGVTKADQGWGLVRQIKPNQRSAL